MTELVVETSANESHKVHFFMVCISVKWKISYIYQKRYKKPKYVFTSLQEDVMQLSVVNGVLFSGDYYGIVKKWDVSNKGNNQIPRQISNFIKCNKDMY